MGYAHGKDNFHECAQIRKIIKSFSLESFGLYGIWFTAKSTNIPLLLHKRNVCTTYPHFTHNSLFSAPHYQVIGFFMCMDIHAGAHA